eukprot:757283-Hanusia_phi.AAC.2
MEALLREGGKKMIRSKSLNISQARLLMVEKEKLEEFQVCCQGRWEVKNDFDCQAILRSCINQFEADMKKLVEAGGSDKGILGLTLAGSKVKTVIAGSPASQPVTGGPLRPGDDLLRVNGVAFNAERSSSMISKAVRNSLTDSAEGNLHIECRRRGSNTVDTVVCCLAASSSPLSSACHALTAAVLEALESSTAQRTSAQHIEELAKHLMELSNAHEETVRQTIEKSRECLAQILELSEQFEQKECKLTPVSCCCLSETQWL